MKGPSWLGTVPNFDLVQGLSCDYMHCVLLGVCRILLRLWHDSKHHQEIWYLGTVVKELDARLCSIRPPSEIKRTPRSIENSLKFWKGTYGYLGWFINPPSSAHTHCVHNPDFIDVFTAHERLLHYSPVVLVGHLDSDYYQHHLLLVEAVYLLLKDSILEADLVQSEP